jgi:hypothetical protein
MYYLGVLMLDDASTGMIKDLFVTIGSTELVLSCTCAYCSCDCISPSRFRCQYFREV